MPTPAVHGAVDPVIVALYGLLAVAATGRSAVQLAGHASEAPLAYGLSAVAAAFYLVAGLALRRLDTAAWAPAAARLVCTAELTGVTVVGTLTLLRPGLFPHDTVWSAFGLGYAFAPFLLPALVLVALTRTPRPSWAPKRP